MLGISMPIIFSKSITLFYPWWCLNSMLPKILSPIVFESGHILV